MAFKRSHRRVPLYDATRLENIWASIDATCFAGGRVTLSGTLSNDLQQHWRFRTAQALPVDARNSVKLCASYGLSVCAGNSFDLLGAAWQFRWGGGL